MTRTSRILAVGSAWLAFCFATHADQTVSLAWDASSDHATAGYVLHYGAASRSYTSQINVGTNTVVTLSALKAGQTYYFVVGGYDRTGMEGIPSNEASFVAPTNPVVPPPSASKGIIVSPAAGAVGTSVYIYGTNLSKAGSVTFNTATTVFTYVSDALLIATIPQGATTGPLSITTPAGTLSSQFTVVAAPAPANDTFAGAKVLTGTAAFAWTDTTWATKQPGEPAHAGNNGGASVWYRWTAPVSGAFALDPDGTEFDALLAVYTGNSVTGLSLVANNTGAPGLPVNFQATAGVTYQIAADGFNGERGNMILRLSPVLVATTIFSDAFETTEGLLSGSKLAGQNGWLGSVSKLTGIGNNYFPGYGQQGYIGFSALSLLSPTALLYHPLNFAVDTNNCPVIQFSVLLLPYNPLNLFRDSFGWVFRNAAGQELFGVSFDNATGVATYNLDDGAGPRSTGLAFDKANISQLVMTADFSRNQWSATLNGTPIVAGQPMTTAHAALTLGDVAAKASFLALQCGADGMLFDNYSVTAEPSPMPHIVLGPQNQSAIAGSNLELGVIAGGSQPLSYQWYFNNTAIPGATDASLSLKSMAAGQSGNYKVIVANANGSAAATAAVSIAGLPPKGLLTSPVSMGNRGQLLNFSLVSGSNYRLQVSTNLTSWSTLGSFYANSTNGVFLDPAAGTFARRFYRLVSP